MSQKLRDWMATPAESRTAWIIAAACVILIVTAFVRPLVRDEPVTTDHNTKPERHAITAEKRQAQPAPAEEVRAGEQSNGAIEKIIEKAQQKPAETVAPKAEPKAASVAVKPVAAKPVAAARSIPKPITPKPATSKPAVPKPRATTSAGTLPKGYYVQLGAFSKPGGANTLRKKLSPTLSNLHLKKKGSGITAVWAGPYATRNEAGKAMDEIARRTDIKGYVTSN